MPYPFAGTRHLPHGVDDGGVSEVIVRNGAADLRREPEPCCDGIRKGVAQGGCGVAVHRFAVSVRTSDLEAVAHRLLDTELKRLISGVGIPIYPPDKPEVRVDPILGGGVREPHVSAWGGSDTGAFWTWVLRTGENHIEIIASDDHVDAMGANITHRRCQAGCDLALEVDIPLLDVISLGIRIDIRATELACRQRACRAYRWREELRVSTPWGWIGDGAGQNAKCPVERRSRRIGDLAREEKRLPILTEPVSRQRKHVKDGEASANGHLPIAAGIPGKTDSRLEIASGGVRVVRGDAGASRLSEYHVSRGGSRRPAIG